MWFRVFNAFALAFALAPRLVTLALPIHPGTHVQRGLLMGLAGLVQGFVSAIQEDRQYKREDMKGRMGRERRPARHL